MDMLEFTEAENSMYDLIAEYQQIEDAPCYEGEEEEDE